MTKQRSFYIYTLGCKVNRCESEAVSDLLCDSGRYFALTDDEKYKADINACVNKQPHKHSRAVYLPPHCVQMLTKGDQEAGLDKLRGLNHQSRSGNFEPAFVRGLHVLTRAAEHEREHEKHHRTDEHIEPKLVNNRSKIKESHKKPKKSTKNAKKEENIVQFPEKSVK